jgi:hypothetical protein
MTNTVISFPIPPYQNLPAVPANFQPSLFYITAIVLGFTTTVTTSVNHNYVVGQLVRLLIPNGFGSRQLNEVLGFVTSIPAPNQVILDINSSQADPFIVNPALRTQPQIVAIGDINAGNLNSNGRILNIAIPGSFNNISQ